MLSTIENVIRDMFAPVLGHQLTANAHWRPDVDGMEIVTHCVICRRIYREDVVHLYWRLPAPVDSGVCQAGELEPLIFKNVRRAAR